MAGVGSLFTTQSAGLGWEGGEDQGQGWGEDLGFSLSITRAEGLP